MKKIKLLGVLLVMITVMACEMPLANKQILIDNNLSSTGYNTKGCYYIEGMLQNTTKKAIHNVHIHYNAYYGGVLLDTVNCLVADGATIPAGISTRFTAVFTRIGKYNAVDRITYEVTYE